MPNHIVSGDVDSMLRSANDAAIRSAIGVGTTDSPTFLGVSTTTGGVLTSGSIEAGNGAVLGGTNSITVRTTNGTPALFRAFQATRANWTFGSSASSSSFDFLEAGTLRAQLTNTGNFSATSSLSAPVLTLTGQSLTGTQSTSLVDLATTWLSTTGTPTAIKLNVTDTLSNANSLLMDLQVGGLSKFKVDKTGVVTAVNVYSGGSVGYALFNDIGLGLRSAAVIGWTAGTAVNAQDTILARDAPGILAQRNVGNAQMFRVYNTYTDASNYERVSIGQSAGAFRILAENLGSGTTARQLQIGTNTFASLSFLTDATVKWQISAAGHFLAATHNTYDIGASGGVSCPRNVYMGSWIRMAVTTVASLPAAATAGAGARMFVNDALTPVFGNAVAGSGLSTVPVYSTGSAWNVG